MLETNERPVCHRAEDLVTYLYGEASEIEARDFREHLRACDSCRGEFSIFNQVHESIALWRNESLGATFNPAPAVAQVATDLSEFRRPQRRLSAVAALREFFAVSPLWLRGATAFAGLLLFVLIALSISRMSQRPAPVANAGNAPKFTQSDLDKAVAEAKMETARQQQTQANERVKPGVIEKQNRSVQVAVDHDAAKQRVKPLTIAERQ